MRADPSLPDDGATLTLRILEAADLDAAFAETLPVLHAMLRAGTLVLFAVEDGRPTHARWWPESADDTGRDFRPFRDEAARVLGGAPPRPGLSCVALRADGEVQGLLVHDGPGESPESVVVAARALAWRMAHERQRAQAGAARAQYERWFRTLDEQLRVLDRERQKFAAIAQHFDAQVFVTDTSRRIRWINSAMGATPPAGPVGSSWIGRGCHAVCSAHGAADGAHECADCPLRVALERGEGTHREYRQGSGITARSHYLSALPIKGPDGRSHEVVVMVQDLSDLEIVRKSESRYRVLFEHSTRAMLMVNPVTGAIVLANPVAMRLTGYGHDALMNMCLEDLHAPREWLRAWTHYETLFRDAQAPGFDCAIRTEGGAEREVLVSGMRYEFGAQELVLLELEDVTERRRVKLALEKARERLRSVITNAPIILFAVDRNGIFTLSEGRALEAVGLAPGEVVGQSAFELYRDQPEVVDALRRALAGETFTEIVHIGAHAFETRYLPLLDDEGWIEGMLAVATDVSERRRLEQQLRHAQRMEAIGRLAGGVAHDFNNLLAAILGHGELMLSELGERDPLRRNAEEIHKAGVRGAMLTRQLLAFSRKEVVAPAVVDLNDVVGDLEEMLERLIGEDVQLISERSQEPARVKADRGQLEQIVMNLALNARDAMTRGGRMTIRVETVDVREAGDARHPGVEAGTFCVLTVTDDGVGMDRATLARAFEPFFTTKPPGKGTGLGLATVYGVVEANGGHVWASSEPGQGTTLRIYLPRSDEAALAPRPVALPTPSTNRGAETILVAEDEDTVRSVTREVLEAYGYRVLEAANGEDAVRVAAAHLGPIHMLVSDVVMPEMGGGELARRLAESRPELRVMFVSGYADDSLVQHGVRERHVAFMQKPFSLDAFVAKVREVLDSEAPGAAA